ncbi:unknown [Prevotella sp. CAG:755]|nr:unknown [Prevotella sp. CAG:755]
MLKSKFLIKKAGQPLTNLHPQTVMTGASAHHFFTHHKVSILSSGKSQSIPWQTPSARIFFFSRSTNS